MSSLSNKSFHLPELKAIPSALSQRIGAANKLELDYLHKDYFDFYIWLSRVQENSFPALLSTEIISFAGDHRIAKLIPTPKFNTGEFLLDTIHSPVYDGLLERKFDFNHQWLDVGVNYNFESNLSYWLNHTNKLISSKVKSGTECFDLYPSMTDDELSMAFYTGSKLVDRAHYKERDLLIFHSLGEGQLLSVYALAWALSISNSRAWEGYFPNYFSQERIEGVLKAIKRHPISHSPFINLCFFGGLEIASIVGAIIRASEKSIPFIVSDPAAIIAWQYAEQIAPGVASCGYGVGAYTSHLSSTFNTLTENLNYRSDGADLYTLLLKLSSNLKRFNQL